MTSFRIVTAGETYTVTRDGLIGRPKIGMAPSGGWKALALVRRNNFGTIEYIPFSEWSKEKLDSLQWQFKNGRNRYTLRDLDHGTVREWSGNPPNKVSRVYAEGE